jgi:hypothetical protein
MSVVSTVDPISAALATRFGLALSLAPCGVGFLMAALMMLLLPRDARLQSVH